MYGIIELLICYTNTTTVLIGLLVFLVVGYILSQREQAGIPPGPSFLPWVGNYFSMRGRYFNKRHVYFDHMRKKYGNIFRIYFGSTLTIVLCDRESINEAFVKQKNLFSVRPLDKLWDVRETNKTGSGIIWSNGDLWKSLRRMTLHTLRDLGVGKATLDKKIKDETNYVLDVLNNLNCKPIRIHDTFMKVTANIIGNVVFGSRFEYDDPDYTEIISFMKVAFESEGPFTIINVIPQIRYLPIVSGKLMELMKGVNHITDFISRKIQEHEETLVEDHPRDFIDICLIGMSKGDDSTLINKQALVKTILDLFLAGSDTTANTLDWALLYMILYPEIQQKCQREIDEVVGGSRMVEWADRNNMPYMEATLMEIQRVANIAPITLPHTATQDTVVNNYLIPAGSLVYAHIRACHLDEDKWENPQEFNPDRFMDENGKPVKNINLFPFSIGPRVCPGEPLARMELFLIFTNILQRFTVYNLEGQVLSTEGNFGVTISTMPYLLKVKQR